MEKVCKNKDFWDTEILAFNSYQKSDKIASVVYADLESLIKKVGECKDNLEKLFKTKIGEHFPCG